MKPITNLSPRQKEAFLRSHDVDPEGLTPEEIDIQILSLEQKMHKQVKNALSFIHEKAESKGYENAYHLAESEFGKDIAELAWSILNTSSTKEHASNALKTAIAVLLHDHPEYEEENSTGWDMIEALKDLWNTLR